MKNKTVIWISFIVGLLAFIYAMWEFSFDDILNNHYGTLEMVFLYILVVLIIQVLLTYRWKIILNSQGIQMNIFELNNIRMAGQAISFLTPAARLGGEPVKAAILAKKKKLTYKKSLSSIVIDKSLDISSSGIFFVLGIFLLLLTFSVNPQTYTVLVPVAAGILAIIFVFNYYMIKGRTLLERIISILGLNKITKVYDYIVKIEEPMIFFYKKDFRKFLKATLISATTWFFMFIEYSILARIVGVNIGIVEVFVIVSVIGLAYIVPIPMALGALELGQVGVFRFLGLGASAGIALALIVRIKDIVLSIIGLFLVGFYGVKLKEVWEK